MSRLCGCGCGQPAQPSARFIAHHFQTTMTGKKHPMWTPTPTYSSIHRWLQRHHPKTGLCQFCGLRKGLTDYALIKGHVHAMNRLDYLELCRRCHVRYDRYNEAPA